MNQQKLDKHHDSNNSKGIKTTMETTTTRFSKKRKRQNKAEAKTNENPGTTIATTKNTGEQAVRHQREGQVGGGGNRDEHHETGGTS